jgi:uncharacterized DUF497 family protein
MEFEWDENKNRQNIKKHGISFEEATAIFDKPFWTRIDDRYDYREVREVSIGDIGNFVIVVVAHTERKNKTRVISARKATPRERRRYYEYLTTTT